MAGRGARRCRPAREMLSDGLEPARCVAYFSILYVCSPLNRVISCSWTLGGYL